MRGLLVKGSGFMGNTVEAWAHGQSRVGALIGDGAAIGSGGNTWRLKLEPGPGTTALQVYGTDDRYELDVLGCEGNATAKCGSVERGLVWGKSAARNSVWLGLMKQPDVRQPVVDESLAKDNRHL